MAVAEVGFVGCEAVVLGLPGGQLVEGVVGVVQQVAFQANGVDGGGELQLLVDVAHPLCGAPLP